MFTVKTTAGTKQLAGFKCSWNVRRMHWPNGIPDDLRDMLDGIAKYRSPPASAEVWQVVKEWLEKHDVKPPANGFER